MFRKRPLKVRYCSFWLVYSSFFPFFRVCFIQLQEAATTIKAISTFSPTTWKNAFEKPSSEPWHPLPIKGALKLLMVQGENGLSTSSNFHRWLQRRLCKKEAAGSGQDAGRRDLDGDGRIIASAFIPSAFGYVAYLPMFNLILIALLLERYQQLWTANERPQNDP